MSPVRDSVQGLAGLVGSLLCLLFMSAALASPHYTDLRRIAPIHGDAAAGAGKSTLCASCHGANGESVAPMFPRLAGQRVNYLYHRLWSFRHADPKDPYYSVSPMTAMAATLSDTDMRDLAAYFAGQTPHAPDPQTLPATPPASTQAGAQLFLGGDPGRGIPPCQGCHGADANGPVLLTDQYLAYPSLRGQNALYVAARLTSFRGGQPSDTTNAFIMHGVAATLDDDSIQAIAAWLGSLPPAIRP
jgi:cytochrome c553